MFFGVSRIDIGNEKHYCTIMDRMENRQDHANERNQELPARIASGALLGSRKEVVIVHNGREYRLRITQNGRLILTA